MWTLSLYCTTIWEIGLLASGPRHPQHWSAVLRIRCLGLSSSTCLYTSNFLYNLDTRLMQIFTDNTATVACIRDSKEGQYRELRSSKSAEPAHGEHCKNQRDGAGLLSVPLFMLPINITGMELGMTYRSPPINTWYCKRTTSLVANMYVVLQKGSGLGTPEKVVD